MATKTIAGPFVDQSLTLQVIPINNRVISIPLIILVQLTDDVAIVLYQLVARKISYTDLHTKAEKLLFQECRDLFTRKLVHVHIYSSHKKSPTL